VTLVAVFMLVVGAAIITFWGVSVTAGRVPELAAGQRAIRFHIAAEIAVAAALVVAGVAVLTRVGPYELLAAATLGALLYTTLNSAGYYVDHRDPAMLGMFAVVGGGAIASLAVVLG
jgi:hypothetical protein